jgi:hypothetical protein
MKRRHMSGSREFSGAGALAGSVRGGPGLVALACCLGPRGLALEGGQAQ